MLSSDDSNALDNIVGIIKLIITKRDNKSSKQEGYIEELLSKINSIFRSRCTSKVFLYLCQHGAATGWALQYMLKMPEPSVYRSLKHLRSMGLVYPALKIKYPRRSKVFGPRPRVWALEGATPEDVSEAIKLHMKLISPKYRVAQNLAQTLLDEYSKKGKPMEITYREIVIYLKELKIPYAATDIAELIARYLHENGVKVWR